METHSQQTLVNVTPNAMADPVVGKTMDINTQNTKSDADSAYAAQQLNFDAILRVLETIDDCDLLLSIFLFWTVGFVARQAVSGAPTTASDAFGPIKMVNHFSLSSGSLNRCHGVEITEFSRNLLSSSEFSFNSVATFQSAVEILKFPRFRHIRPVGIQWDEQNLAQNEDEKVPRMKIDEPKTPFHVLDPGLDLLICSKP